jgi:hypothetical protein
MLILNGFCSLLQEMNQAQPAMATRGRKAVNLYFKKTI